MPVQFKPRMFIYFSYQRILAEISGTFLFFP
uniref:Uncharacterized protein n=1 Tax=Rhizophora mucronata TaxID=61149 RepID=A0A2P2PWP1_RHIMU